MTEPAAIALFAAGAITGIPGVVRVAISQEDRNPALTSAAPDTVTRAGRWVNGVMSAPPASPTPDLQMELV